MSDIFRTGTSCGHVFQTGTSWGVYMPIEGMVSITKISKSFTMNSAHSYKSKQVNVLLQKRPRIVGDIHIAR